MNPGVHMNVTQAKAFILQNARPLERAIYRWHFEGGDAAAVVEALGAFQNPDGGFGHALEPDNWNPRSNPIAVNDALITLRRVGMLKADNPMVGEMLRYLRSGDEFDPDARRWRFAVASNADHPHAIWWERQGDGVRGFNPTASLAAFALCFGGRDPALEAILREAAAALETPGELIADDLKCYMLCHDLLREHGVRDVVDLDALGRTIVRRLDGIVCTDASKYGVEYVPLPSDFFAWGNDHFLSPGMRHWIDVEKGILPKLQRPDGGFDISWQWYTPWPEFEQARTWWRARITIDKLLFFLNH